MALQAKIANSFQNFKSKGPSNMNKGNAESRLFGLEKNYTTFQGNHEKILKLEDLDKTMVILQLIFLTSLKIVFMTAEEISLIILKVLREIPPQTPSLMPMLWQSLQVLLKLLISRFNRCQK